MQITVDRAHLANAAAWAQKGIGRRIVVPILAGMRVTVADGKLTLATFDYDVMARAHVFGDAAEAGSALVPGAQIAAAVKAMPKARGTLVTITGDDTAGLTFTSGPVSSTIAPTGWDTDEYPALPEMPPTAGVVAGDVFGRMVARAGAAAGSDDTLPVLTCVRIELAERLTMVATDRYRLAVDRGDWTPASEDYANTAITVHAAALAAFAKSAGGAGKITIFAAPDTRPEKDRGFGGAGGFAGFASEERELLARINEGSFPRVHSLIPAESETVVVADAAALLAAVKRAAATCGRNSRMGFTANGSIALVPTRDGVECGIEHVPAERTGPEVESGFNAAYLASMLAGVSGPVRIGFNGPAKPAVIMSAAETGDDYRGLVMPIRNGSEK